MRMRASSRTIDSAAALPRSKDWKAVLEMA